MAEEIAVETGWTSNFERLVILTLTLDRVILHTVVHHSLTSTFMPNFIEIEETFCGQTDVRTFESGFIRSSRSKSRSNKYVGRPYCPAKMYAGRVACCPLVSHSEYADETDTDERTPDCYITETQPE